MVTWAHDDNPPPDYPYLKAVSARSAAVQLYARSGQLATADILKRRNQVDNDLCRLGCGNSTESARHIFLLCPTYEMWRMEARDQVVEKTKLRTETMNVWKTVADNLICAAKSLFIDDELIWPLHYSLYYLGQVPKIDNMLYDLKMTRTQKQQIKSHISSDWHTAAMRLAGRIFRRLSKTNGGAE